MIELRPDRRLCAAALAALFVALLVGCSAEGTYHSSCDSPIAAAYTPFCNPYIERGRG